MHLLHLSIVSAPLHLNICTVAPHQHLSPALHTHLRTSAPPLHCLCTTSSKPPLGLHHLCTSVPAPCLHLHLLCTCTSFSMHHLCTFAPLHLHLHLHLCTCTSLFYAQPLHLFSTFEPLLLHSSAPLLFCCTSATLHLCTTSMHHICTSSSAPLHLLP